MNAVRFILICIVWLLNGSLVIGQTSLKEINLKNGPYKVGFRHYIAIDSTRTYQVKNEFTNQFVYRPIPVSLWYPTSTESNTEQLTVLDYLEVLKEEEEWKNLPNEYLLDWFPYLWNTPENKKHLAETVSALSNTRFLDGKYPVIVYAPSYQASSIENFYLFEYLASHGFVVISSPSRGTESRKLEGGTTKDLETQSRDVEFLLKETYKYSIVDPRKVALMGFSFGGLSNMIATMRNKNVLALVSLDGTERYNYEVLSGSAYFQPDKIDIPYIHFAQKNIPETVLREDKIPETLNTAFQLFDSIKYGDVYSYKFHDLTHSYFSSFGVLFANRDKRQDKGDDAIMNSYRILAEHTLHFLNATLKNDAQGISFIENDPPDNGYSNSLISKKMKKSQGREFNYKDFIDLAGDQDFEDLDSLYKEVVEEHPDLILEEGMLNTLGLRLMFDPERIQQGIQVFLLAVHIYPNSANLYDSLGEAYMISGEFEKAIASFERSLELNPHNQNAINRLKELK